LISLKAGVLIATVLGDFGLTKRKRKLDTENTIRKNKKAEPYK